MNNMFNRKIHRFLKRWVLLVKSERNSGWTDTAYLNIFENPLVFKVGHNIIYCIWRQPNINFHIKVAKRTFWYADLPRVTLRSIYFVTLMEFIIGIQRSYQLRKIILETNAIDRTFTISKITQVSVSIFYST